MLFYIQFLVQSNGAGANTDKKGTPPLTSATKNACGTHAESEELKNKNVRICAFVQENYSIFLLKSKAPAVSLRDGVILYGFISESKNNFLRPGGDIIHH